MLEIYHLCLIIPHCGLSFYNLGMGTEIQVKSNLLGHYSMRDLNDNSNICSWPPYPRDNVLPNSHYYNGYLPRSAAEVYPVLGKDILKHTMLEHEAIFRKQVYSFG